MLSWPKRKVTGTEQLNELDARQFKATVVQPMRQVAEKNVPEVDLESYLKECNEKCKLLKKRSDFVPIQVYTRGDNRHVHVTLWYGIPDHALVLVVDRPQKTILGHYFLKVDDEGGAADFPWPIRTPNLPVLSTTNKRNRE